MSYPSLKEHAKQLGAEISSIPYYEEEKERLENNLAALYGRFHPRSGFPEAIPPDLRGKSVNKVMPKYHGKPLSEVEIFDKIDQTKKRLTRINANLTEAWEMLDYANPEERILLERLFIDKERKTRVAEELGLTRPSLDRRINGILKKLVKNSFIVRGLT